MTIEELRFVLGQKWSDVIAQLCMNIVLFMHERDRKQLEMLTFRTLTQAAGKREFDLDVLSAVTILSSSEISALIPHAALIDDDDEQYEIPLLELAEARKLGTLIHPETGVEISDFEEMIVPYFVPSENFLK